MFNAITGYATTQKNQDQTITITTSKKLNDTVKLTTDEIERLVYMIKLAFDGQIADKASIKIPGETTPKEINTAPIVKQTAHGKTCIIDIQRNTYTDGAIINGISIDGKTERRTSNEYCYFVFGTCENPNPADEAQNAIKTRASAIAKANNEQDILEFLKEFEFRSAYVDTGYKIRECCPIDS